MPIFSDATDPSAPPLSDREQKRFLRLQIWVWGKQFAGRLKANALRMKKFLHGND